MSIRDDSSESKSVNFILNINPLRLGDLQLFLDQYKPKFKTFFLHFKHCVTHRLRKLLIINSLNCIKSKEN